MTSYIYLSDIHANYEALQVNKKPVIYLKQKLVITRKDNK